MRKEDLIKIIKYMGLMAKEEDSKLMVRTKDGALVACVSEYSTYDMRLFEKNITGYSNIGIDILANALFEYAKTPIKERDDVERYYLKHKFLANSSGHSYLKMFIENGFIVLGNHYQTENEKTKFTQKEIDIMKMEYDTDFNDFEIIKVK